MTQFKDGEKRYMIAQNGLQVGQKVVSGEKVAPEIGNAMALANIPLGTIISVLSFILEKVQQLREVLDHLRS